ncbi:MAG TPA: hypothetical protein VGO67_04990 [Verrucomicrobiae bacterium]|jgi:hypothetical protein
MNPELFALSLIEWQLFATLTFKSEKMTDAVRIKMFFALMREQADNFGVHFKETIWCLRREDGELTGRGHLHALIAGFPQHALTTATCFAFMKIWERMGGGMARVTLYSPLLDGVGYVLKGCEAEYQRAGGDFYEAKKFGGHCDVMLSESVFRVLAGRRQIGKRRRQGQRQAE